MNKVPPVHAVPTNAGQLVDGYIVNAAFSKQSQATIAALQAKLAQRFPGALWIAPQPSLHITLLDWLTPVTDYGVTKPTLFKEIRTPYMDALRQALRDRPPIQVTFDAIEVYPAAIIIKGHDDGSYQAIREKFLGKIELLEGTKPPPDIIHTTICRFNKDVALLDVAREAKQLHINFQETTREFRLVHETQVFMQRFRTLEVFSLEHAG